MGSPHTWYVQGQAGTGKTTLVNHLLIELLEKDILAFRIDNLMLRRVAPPTPDVVAFARQARPAEIPEAFWKSRVKHARLVVLVDGINEIRREFEGSIE
ncbi:MAG TPA: NACHT domain-containing protein, partial [Longimicrobiaceae bacterium]|nr:NACHT domain-containing protein [Longimicrobiaceae bacterium]